MRILTRTLNQLAQLIGGCVHCGAHGAPSELSPRLCVDCAAHLHFAPHRCTTCAQPLATDDAQCLPCLQQPPHFVRTDAFADYSGTLKHLIVQYKFHRKLAYAPLLADLLSHAWRDIEPPDVVIAVPQHEAMTRQRGFIPLEYLLQCVDNSPPVRKDAIVRVHQPHLQVGASASARRQHIKGAFAATADLTGLRVLIIDDVYTTGATLREMAAVCHAAGAAQISNLVIARARLDA
ncbi:MAG: ComF family protein [Formosimonas sp.]